MAKAIRVAVLFHARERPFAKQYLVHDLAHFWREDGLEVVYLYGIDRFVPADLVLVHVDLSIVPESYLEFAARYPVVLNGRVRYIRKRVISRQLVRPGDDGWDGPVIVKSDLNSGGYPEYWNSLPRLRRLRALRAAASRLGIARGRRNYRVFERLEDVPASVIEDPDLVVERFLPDFEDGLYYLHMYQFLGNGERCARLGSGERVFKVDTSTTASVAEPHPATRAWREELGLDYGKIDYTVHEGEVILLDANKTTGSASYLDARTLEAERRRQAGGIHSYFAGLKPL